MVVGSGARGQSASRAAFESVLLPAQKEGATDVCNRQSSGQLEQSFGLFLTICWTITPNYGSGGEKSQWG